MKKLQPTTQYKKDYKKYRNNPKKVEALKEVLKMLHMLLGEYKDCMECHIGGDFLLIWIDEETDTIELVRLGSHSELFK